MNLASLTGNPSLHGSKVSSRLGLAIVDNVDGTAGEHGDVQTGRAANGLLAGGNNGVQTPLVKGNLLAGNTADTVGNDQGVGGDTLDDLAKALEVEENTCGGIDVSGGDDLVLLLLESLLNLVRLRAAADGTGQLGDVGTVGSQAVGETVTEVTSGQDESVLTRLDQVDGDHVPTQGARAVDDEWLRLGVGGLEELAQHGEGVSEGRDEGRSDVGLAVFTLLVILSHFNASIGEMMRILHLPITPPRVRSGDVPVVSHGLEDGIVELDGPGDEQRRVGWLSRHVGYLSSVKLRLDSWSDSRWRECCFQILQLSLLLLELELRSRMIVLAPMLVQEVNLYARNGGADTW